MSTKELLFSLTKKDFKIDFFSGSGAGGQHRNKHQNCVRIFHPPSGARGLGQSHKSRTANMREALAGLVRKPEFKVWHCTVVAEILSGQSIQQRVDEMTTPDKLKIEHTDQNGRWFEVTASA